MEEIETNKYNKSNSPEVKTYIINLLQDIISEINLKENLNINIVEEGNKIKDNLINIITIRQKYSLKIIKSKIQEGGALCGFYCLFNLINFLKFLKNSEKIEKEIYYLKKINSGSQFWRFYLNNIKFLLDSPYVYEDDKESLKKKGPLERYQFNLLIEKKTNISKKLASDESSSICIYSFFFAFDSIVSENKDEILKLQEVKMSYLIL